MLKVFVLLGVFFCVGVGGVENENPLLAMDVLNLVISLLDDVGENCRRDLLEYFRGILHGETWALKMIDSMEKFPVGLLLGRITALGQFEECLSVVHPDFKGQHCTVDISPKHFRFFQESGNLTLMTGRSVSSLERAWRNEYGYGVCIPSTCNSTDLKSIVAAAGLNEVVKIEVTESDCTSTAYQELRVKDYLTMSFLLFVVLLALASTVYDVYYTGNKDKEDSIFKSFSLRYNWNILFNTNGKSSEMGAVNGIRFLSMVWIILGHCVFYEYIFGEAYNILDRAEMLNKAWALFETNAFPSVDSFFFLSGLLICFVFFRDIAVKGSYDFPTGIIQRYIRLTPPLLIMVLINFTLFSRIVTGPISKRVYEGMEQSCQVHWWTFALHIQNFFFSSRKCFTPSWYVAADMQMFLISPLIMYVLLFRPKFAPTYFGLLIVGSSLASFIMAYENDLPANYLLELLKGRKNFEYFYAHTRMAPWIVGILTGYILCGIRTNKITFKPKRIWVAVGWLVSAALLIGSVYGLAAFLEPAPERTTFEKSAYRSFHRLGWALGLSWVVIACVEGYGGIVNTLLSMKIFGPLAKLTYSMYLIHMPVQRYRNFHFSRHSERVDAHTVLYTFTADLAITVAFAIPVTLLFEMPFINLSKFLLKNLKIFPYPKSDKYQKELCDSEKGKQLEEQKEKE